MPKERKILQIDSSSSNLRKPHILRLKQFLYFFLRQWSIRDSDHAEKHKGFRIRIPNCGVYLLNNEYTPYILNS